MDHKQFSEILDLAYIDVKGLQPDAIGAAMLVLGKDEKDGLQMKLVANVDMKVVQFALTHLLRRWRAQGIESRDVATPKRKRVV